MDPTLTAFEIARAVRSGRSKAVTIVEETLERARQAAALNSFITIDVEGALGAAARIDEMIAAGDDPGPLAGVPIAVKDNLLTAGLRTTAASEILHDFVPPIDATVVARLRQAGAIVIGKTNMDEFGMGSTNENSAFGPVHNPWNRGRVPGGSSGGAAVAVAAGIVPLSIASDTGGSVRQPAAFCGTIGFKPTYGVLSRYGLIAFASSLDQVGVLGRSGPDVTLALQVMAGHDELDATTLDSLPEPGGEWDLKAKRIGVVTELNSEGNAPEIERALAQMVEWLRDLGSEVAEVSLPNARHGVPAYYLVATAEASSNLSRFDGTIYGKRYGDEAAGQAQVMMETRGRALGTEVRRRVLMGTYALSAGYKDAYYSKALKARRLIANDFERAFEQFDLLITPTTPAPAYELGTKADDPLQMYVGDVDTCLANLVGIPAVSVPAGRSADGLPLGIQFAAPPLGDGKLLAATSQLERYLGDDFAPVAPI